MSRVGHALSQMYLHYPVGWGARPGPVLSFFAFNVE